MTEPWPGQGAYPGWPPQQPQSALPPVGPQAPWYPVASTGGWAPTPGWPPASPPNRGGAWKWILVVGVVATAVVVVAVVIIGRMLLNTTKDLAVGDCVTNADYTADNLKPTDCRDVDAVYELAGRADLGICPDGKPAKDGNYFYVAGKTEQLCFAVNLKQDECYLFDISAQTMSHLDCAEAPSRASSTTGPIRVLDRIDGTFDTSRCGSVTIPWAYTAPQRVYCLEKLAR